MHIKNLVIGSGLALSLLSSSIVVADQPTNPMSPSHKHQQCHKGMWKGKMLSPEERQQVHALMKEMRQQMKPLIREKHALKLQLMGKLATPNTQWEDVAALVKNINETNAKMTTLRVQTQLKSFQTIGIMLPMSHGKHFGHHSR